MDARHAGAAGGWAGPRLTRRQAVELGAALAGSALLAGCASAEPAGEVAGGSGTGTGQPASGQSSAASQQAAQDDGPLYAAYLGTGMLPGTGGWGFINASGAWVIPPQFSDIAGKPGWTAGVSPVNDRLYGEALDITPGVFSGDLYAVCRYVGYTPVWCYINRQGEVVIDNLDGAFNFTGSYALAKPAGSGSYTLIDKSGNLPIGQLAAGDQITCPTGVSADGIGGCFFIQGEAGGVSGWGCVDLTGSWALASAANPVAPYVYAEPLVFSEGFATAKGAPYADAGVYTIVDAGGAAVAQVAAQAGAGGGATLCRGGRLFIDGRLYDTAGNLLQGEPRAFVSAYYEGVPQNNRSYETGWPFSDSAYFSNGVCPVQEAYTGLWGLIDQSGAYVVEPRYGGMGAFGEDGLALARPVGTETSGLLDASGSWALGPRFNSYTDLVGQLVSANGTDSPNLRYSFGEVSGTKNPETSRLAHRFVGDLAFVASLGTWTQSPTNYVVRAGWIDRQGNWVRSWITLD